MAGSDIRPAVVSSIQSLERGEHLDSATLATKLDVDHGVLVDGALKALSAALRISLEPVTHARWTVSEEGLSYASLGSPEYRVYKAVAAASPDSLLTSALDEAVGKAAAARGRQQALQRKWIEF
eukprot:IDg16885t1